MSTRCLIGRQYKDKTIRYIYCHCDGYIDGVGTVLKKFYSDEETIDKLLDLGDLSAIGTVPEECPDNLEELFHETFEYWLKWKNNPTDENKAAYDDITALYDSKNRKFCHLLDTCGDSVCKIATDKKIILIVKRMQNSDIYILQKVIGLSKNGATIHLELIK